MQTLTKWMIATAFVATVILPLGASAYTGIPFGGTVVSMIPCISPAGPAVWFSIVPVGPTPLFAFIWTAATLGLPPVHPGQQILGMSDVPFGCSAGVVKLFGQRVQYNGVSI